MLQGPIQDITLHLAVMSPSGPLGCDSVSDFPSFFFFNWCVIALQCCVSFCCKTTWTSYKYTCVSSLLNHLLPPSHLSRWAQSSEMSSLWPTAASHWQSILHMVVYMSVLPSIHPSLSFPLPPLCPCVCSLYLHLYSCPANRFIVIILLDSIYMH